MFDDWMYYDGIRRLGELERRRTPLQCVMIELAISAILVLAGFAFVVFWLWHAGFRLH